MTGLNRWQITYDLLFFYRELLLIIYTVDNWNLHRYFIIIFWATISQSYFYYFYVKNIDMYFVSCKYKNIIKHRFIDLYYHEKQT